MVVAWDKCNNDIKRENSTGSLSIINRAYIAGPKWDGIPFSGMIKLKLKLFFLKYFESLKNVTFIFLSF